MNNGNTNFYNRVNPLLFIPEKDSDDIEEREEVEALAEQEEKEKPLIKGFCFCEDIPDLFI